MILKTKRRAIAVTPRLIINTAISAVISLLPIAAACLIIAQYRYVPNFKEFTRLDQNAPTNVWPHFVVLITVAFYVFTFLAALLGPKTPILDVRLDVPGLAKWDGRRQWWELDAGEVLRFYRRKAPLFTVALLLLMLYDWATLKTGILPQPFVPWPDAILNAMLRDQAMLTKAVLHSLRLLFTGYGIGVAVGIVTGIAAGWSPQVRYWVQPLTRLFGAIPPITWVPIIVVLPMSLFRGAVLLISLAVWYPVTNTTMNGVLGIPRGVFEAARTFGTGRFKMIFKVALPAASPFIFAGLAQGMTTACIALLIAEMMGVEAGLGVYITMQRGWAMFAEMYAAVVIIALIFFSVNSIIALIRRMALRWAEGNT